MKWTTHLMAGVSSAWLPSPWLVSPVSPDGIANVGMVAACAALGALLPDLDASESKIKHLKLLGTQFKPFSLPSAVIYRQMGHRGLMHSLVGLATFAAVISPFVAALGWQSVTAMVLGYASHLATDSCTRTGIPLFYPRPGRQFLLPARLRIVTGSDVEEIYFALFACLSLAFLLMHL